jgi:hypothetical protein
MQDNFNTILQSIYNSSNEKCIYNAILLRKLLIELMDIDNYKDNITGSVAALMNAVYSKNIPMIEQETQRFEKKFITTNNTVFVVHPLIYMRNISEFGDEHVELFKTLLYQCLKADIGDRYIIKHLDIWLLNTNKYMYREAATKVYAIAT